MEKAGNGPAGEKEAPMSSNQFSASVNYGQRSPDQVKADQREAQRQDTAPSRAAQAAGRGSRRI